MLNDKTLQKFCKHHHQHRHEVSYDPHCLDDLGYNDTETQIIADAVFIIGSALCSVILLSFLYYLVGDC